MLWYYSKFWLSKLGDTTGYTVLTILAPGAVTGINIIPYEDKILFVWKQVECAGRYSIKITPVLTHGEIFTTTVVNNNYVIDRLKNATTYKIEITSVLGPQISKPFTQIFSTFTLKSNEIEETVFMSPPIKSKDSNVNLNQTSEKIWNASRHHTQTVMTINCFLGLF